MSVHQPTYKEPHFSVYLFRHRILFLALLVFPRCQPCGHHGARLAASHTAPLLVEVALTPTNRALEYRTGFEPAYQTWEDCVLPLHQRYIRGVSAPPVKNGGFYSAQQNSATPLVYKPRGEHLTDCVCLKVRNDLFALSRAGAPDQSRTGISRVEVWNVTITSLAHAEFVHCGAGDRNRTRDLLITNQPLCHLSYASIMKDKLAGAFGFEPKSPVLETGILPLDEAPVYAAPESGVQSVRHCTAPPSGGYEIVGQSRGTPEGIRTLDLPVKSRLLCQLSYWRIAHHSMRGVAASTFVYIKEALTSLEIISFLCGGTGVSGRTRTSNLPNVFFSSAALQLSYADMLPRRPGLHTTKQKGFRFRGWQRRLDSNQRVKESKSSALPLGYVAI